MNKRYLCKKHYHRFCENLQEAGEHWEQSMAKGLQAIDQRELTKGERCFGTAYDIASLIFDRQLSCHTDTDHAGNTLLSAQYLATSLVQLGAKNQAARVLSQLHESFSFACRHPNASTKLKETLCQHLIPYVEKLYQLALGVPRDNIDASPYQQQSNRLH